MSRFGRTLVPLALIVAASCYAIAAERVAFEDGQLLVDGKPFFFFAATVNDNTTELMAKYHFNTMFAYGDLSVKFIDEHEKAGLMQMPYFRGSHISLGKVRSYVGELAAHENIIGWNIGDDLAARHADNVRKIHDWLRENDPRQRPVLLDHVTGPEHTAAYKSFDTLTCVYEYPLLRKALEQYQEDLRRERLAHGEGRFFWTWIQAHTQVWYNQLYFSDRIPAGARYRPYMYPDPEHIRLLCYHAMAAGAKGIILYRGNSLVPEYGGAARIAEAGIISCELDVIGPWLVAGKYAGKVACSGEVDASRFDFPGGSLLLLIHRDEDAEYHADEAFHERTQVKMKLRPEQRILQVGFPEARGLTYAAKGECFDTLPWDLATAVVVTEDATLLGEAERAIAARLGEAAGFAVDVARTKQEHVMHVMAELKAFDADPARLPAAGELARAGEEIAAATSLLAAKEHADAYRAARRAQRRLRAEVHRSWRAMWDDPAIALAAHKRPPVPESDLFADRYGLHDFFLMPFFYRLAHTERAGETSENLLANPSFERIADGEFVGWTTPRMDIHEATGDARTAQNARTGTRALLLQSSRPAYWEQEKRFVDWATANAVSNRVPVRYGDIVEVRAWARLDEDLTKTQRGFMVNLVGYDDDGRQPRSWRNGSIVVNHAARTDGWEEFSVRRMVSDPAIETVALRLAIRGVGKVLFDDASLVVRRAPGNE